MVTPAQFAFGTVFVAALFFTVLLIFRQSKLSAIYGAMSMLLWFTLAGLNLILFAESPELLVLSWLWVAVGLFAFIVTLVIYLMSMKADTENKELTL